MIFIPIKYTIDDIREYVINNSNSNLISVEYRGQDYKYKLICSCGNIFKKSWRDIRRTQNLCCRECLRKIQSKKMAFTYDEVKNYIEIDSNSGCKLLSKEYINAHQKLKLKCKCGNIFWKTLNVFKSGNQRQCNKCAGYKEWDRELVIKYITQYPNLELLNKNDNLMHNSMLKIKCECGNVFKRTFKDFKRYKYKCCQDCMIKYRSLNIRNSYDEVKSNIESIKGYKLLSKKYINYRDRLKIQCPEGHIFYMSYKNFFYEGCRCLVCSESNGEKVIRKYLTANNIKFKQEFTFNDLKGIGGNSLRFDFAIIDNNDDLKLLIEYDGEFHYNSQYNNDSYNMLQVHDKLKDDYCIKNNIKLIRIPYWKFDYIKSILKEALNESI